MWNTAGFGIGKMKSGLLKLSLTWIFSSSLQQSSFYVFLFRQLLCFSKHFLFRLTSAAFSLSSISAIQSPSAENLILQNLIFGIPTKFIVNIHNILHCFPQFFLLFNRTSIQPLRFSSEQFFMEGKFEFICLGHLKNLLFTSFPSLSSRSFDITDVLQIQMITMRHQQKAKRSSKTFSL